MGNANVRAHFDSQAPAWSKYYEANGSMQNRPERFVKALESRLTSGQAVLDFGCGTGQITRAIAKRAWRVTGCDVSDRMLEQARAVTDSNRVNWVKVAETGGDNLPFSDASFDAVIASSVFEYLDDPSGTLGEIFRVLRVGGWALITVPDMRHPKRTLEHTMSIILRFAPTRILLKLISREYSADYLSLSINRFGIDAWQDMFKVVGLVPETDIECVDPLALIVAQRV